MKKFIAESHRRETRSKNIKNRLRIIVASMLLLAASNAAAAIIFVPVSGRYTDPTLSPTSVARLGNDIVRIHTTGLDGELSFEDSDFPPEYGMPARATGKLLVSQELELFVNLALGVVEGHAGGQILVTNENGFVIDGHDDASRESIRLDADVRGTATCLPLNGLDCGQLVVELELNGAMSDPYNPASVGQIRMDTLGSVVWYGDEQGFWAAMSANATLGVNDVMIDSITAMAAGGLDSSGQSAGTFSEHAVGYEADADLDGNDWFQQPVAPVSSGNEGPSSYTATDDLWI